MTRSVPPTPAVTHRNTGGEGLVFGSVCSGIEAASVAWKPLGWKCAFMSEIEAFPRSVLTHHYPETPLHGDFTTIKAGEYEPIDLLVGGTPCQSFSVAGLRGGLDDDRGNLALEYLRLADRLRPRWLVWENVPGVLSSNGGRDFGSILGGMGELGYGVAYRVLDAQFFGVAQRRRRVFVVGYLGDWRRAAAVLFERHSLSGNPAPRREAGKAAPTIPSRSSAGGGLGTDFDCDGGLISSTGATSHCLNAGGMGRQDYETETLIARARPTAAVIGCLNSAGGHAVPGNSVQDAVSHQLIPMIAHTLKGDGFDASEDGDPAGTLAAAGPGAVAYAIQERAVCENPDAGPDGAGFRSDDAAYTLEARAVPQAVAFALRGREGGAMPEIEGDGSRVGALRAAGGGSSRDYVSFGITRDALDRSGDGSGETPGERSGLGIIEEQAQCLKAKGPGAVAFTCSDQSNTPGWERPFAPTLNAQVPNDTSNIQTGVRIGSAVRRLTPRECERLQGFPDGYTLVPHRGKPAADGPRYKALGNSMAVPVMAWIGQRIEAVEAIAATEQRAAA